MIRVYLFNKRLPDYGEDPGWTEYQDVFRDAKHRWSDRVCINSEYNDHYQLWIEFNSEEEACMFKLTEL